MARSSSDAIVQALLKRFPTTFGEDLGIDVSRNAPMPLFLLLVSSELFSARISADQALEAAVAIKASGLTTADHMAASTWKERVRILNQHGYARFDEKTAGFLGEVADLCLSEYGGDLRRLREAAGRDPATERQRLKAFKGIGDVGVDIFFREAQAAWDELYPFADARALTVAHRLALGEDAGSLAKLVPAARFPLLLTALVKADLAGVVDEIGA